MDYKYLYEIEVKKNTDLIEKITELMKFAYTDELTGAYNRHGMHKRLENNNCELHFKLDLPTTFIDNISLIQSYYLPTEYLLTTYENTIFVNSSYKSITTKFESYH